MAGYAPNHRKQHKLFQKRERELLHAISVGVFSEDAPLYMQVSKDGCVLHLCEHYGDCCPGAAMRIQTDELEQYCQQLQAKRHKYGWPAIHETPWGSRDMGIKDPFGNRLVFTNAIST